MIYCPECANRLGTRVIGDLEHAACDACGFVLYENPKLVAAAIVPIDDGLVLGRRARGAGAGAWAIPAGFVERGEPPEIAAVREVFEETHLVVEAERLLALYSETGSPIVLAVYVSRVVGGCLAPSDELSEVGVFSPGALPELAFARDAWIVQDWMQGVRRQEAPID